LPSCLFPKGVRVYPIIPQNCRRGQWARCLFLPTPVGLGFARVLGPTRGGVANVGNSPPILVLWGDTPQPPAMGASPPWTPRLPTLVGLGFARVLGPTRGGVANVGDSPPIFGFVGGHPPHPLPWGLRSPWTPFAHPRGLRVCRRFGPHSYRGGKS